MQAKPLMSVLFLAYFETKLKICMLVLGALGDQVLLLCYWILLVLSGAFLTAVSCVFTLRSVVGVFHRNSRAR